MIMKFPHRFLLFTILAIAPLAAADRPNILFIFSDDHALEAISAYGKRFNQIAPTPNIDRIAKEGMLFERSYCGNSICGPSRATVLSGKHTHLNGFMDNNFSRFDGNQPIFPKMLSKVGYETAIIGKWHLISNPIGFDHWEVLPDQGSYYNPDFIEMDGTTKRVDGYVTDLITDKSLEWLKNRKDKSRPFLLMTQHKAPHRNWLPAERHMKLFDGITMPEPESLFDDYKNRIGAVAKQEMQISRNFTWGHDMYLPGEQTDPRFEKSRYGGQAEVVRMNPDQLKAFNAAYGEENQQIMDRLAKGMSDEELTHWKYQRYMKNYLRTIRAVDENVGRILDYLDESGLAKNTIVIYSADQGFYLGEHGWFDKRWMFEESLSMPFIIRWPGVIKPGVRSQAMIQNIDYAPTFLDVAGAPIPSDMQGVSIVPVLKNEGRAPENWRRAVYYQYSGEYTHSVARHEGVRNERYKLMHFPSTDEWMLFDLQKDPQELVNVAADSGYQPVLVEMRSLFDSLRAQYQVSDSTFPTQRWSTKWWKDRWHQKMKEANTPAARKARVVFIGDSITQGWESDGREAWDKHFAPLGALNWGFAGDCTEHVIWRMQNGDLERENPEVAVLMIGTNNTGSAMRPAAETAQGIRRILDDLAWKWPNTKVVLTAIFPRGASKDNPQRLRNQEINALIQPMADGKRVFWQDFNAKFTAADGSLSKEVMPDLLHLNSASYSIWADALSAKLSELGVK